MSFREKSIIFEEKYSKSITAGINHWKYYKLGKSKEVVLFLTGGLRKASIGFEFLEELAERYTVITADYPPAETIEEFIDGIEEILKTENAGKVNIIGQSYGGIIAQAFSFFKPEWVKKLIISSSGPLLYNSFSIIELKIILKIFNISSEKRIKRLFWYMVSKVFNSNDEKTKEMSVEAEWVIMNRLKKEDIYSHFSVVLSLLKRIKNIPFNKDIAVYVLRSENDVSQSPKDLDKYYKVYGSSLKIISLGNMGHAAMLTTREQYFKIISEII